MIYGAPTYDYYNPYCAVVVGNPVPENLIDYSQAIPKDGQRYSEKGAEFLSLAQQAFRNRDYPLALKLATQASAEMPGDPDMHQFRSLVFFALRDIEQSSAAAFAALSVGPGWDWPTLRGFYTEREHYTEQLRVLEKFTKENPQDAGSRFLLAYHYLMMGHLDAARVQLKKVVELEPRDTVSQELLKSLSPADGTERTPLPPLPLPEKEPSADAKTIPNGESPHVVFDVTKKPKSTVVPPVNESEKPIEAIKPVAVTSPQGPLKVGFWKASPENDVAFELVLSERERFTWSVEAKEETHKFSGTYAILADRLTLTRDNDGKKLVGTITRQGDDKFRFRLEGAPPEDPGLNFSLE